MENTDKSTQAETGTVRIVDSSGNTIPAQPVEIDGVMYHRMILGNRSRNQSLSSQEPPEV